MTKIDRNDLCPCGSGKKYKLCCLKKDQALTSQSTDERKFDYIHKIMEKELSKFTGDEISKAQDLVYDGWETIEVDLREAEKIFRKALKLNPDLADAYNGLASIAQERGNLKSAEDCYRKAYQKAKKTLKTESIKAFHWWGEFETRPYMRVRHGLGLVLLATGRPDEAIAEFKELLKRNPNDNQGIRYLVAPACLIKGEVKEALKEFQWYERHYRNDIPDPHFLLSWGLALYLDKQFEHSAMKFRETIFENPYLIPIILERKPETLPIWHSSNMKEIDYAYDYLWVWGDIWEGIEEAYDFVQFVWEDPEIQEDFFKWVELWTQLKGLKDINKRRNILDLAEEIEARILSPEFFKRLNQFLKE